VLLVAAELDAPPKSPDMIIDVSERKMERSKISRWLFFLVFVVEDNERLETENC
jgi:hypothetical protein